MANAIPRILETIAAMAAAKQSNAAFDERQRAQREAAERVRAADELRRRLEQQSLVFVGQLDEQLRALDRLQGMVNLIGRGGNPLPDRTARLLAWLQARVAAMELRLEHEAIEAQLDAAGLFEDEDAHV